MVRSLREGDGGATIVGKAASSSIMIRKARQKKGAALILGEGINQLPAPSAEGERTESSGARSCCEMPLADTNLCVPMVSVIVGASGPVPRRGEVLP